jgi:hypothetical protein
MMHPAYQLNHDEPAMPSVERPEDQKAEYAAKFYQDVLNAADELGWLMVEKLVSDAKARQ